MGDIVATNGMMSEVVKIYETNQKMERRIRISLICILSAVSVLLVISVFLIMKSHAGTKDAKERLREANSQLSEKNSQLSVANAKLTSAYTRMKEIDNVKTAYLIQYMRQCAVHMDSLDKFRGSCRPQRAPKG